MTVVLIWMAFVVLSLALPVYYIVSEWRRWRR
jgi:hypothetical protein